MRAAIINPAQRFIGQAIKPCSEFGKRFDRVHNQIVIERLQAVKVFDNYVNDSCGVEIGTF